MIPAAYSRSNEGVSVSLYHLILGYHLFKGLRFPSTGGGFNPGLFGGPLSANVFVLIFSPLGLTMGYPAGIQVSFRALKDTTTAKTPSIEKMSEYPTAINQ